MIVLDGFVIEPDVSTLAKRKRKKYGKNYALCKDCAHYQGFFSCKAFSDIPPIILIGEHDHRQSYTGDNGIQFKAIEEPQ